MLHNMYACTLQRPHNAWTMQPPLQETWYSQVQDTVSCGWSGSRHSQGTPRKMAQDILPPVYSVLGQLQARRITHQKQFVPLHLHRHCEKCTCMAAPAWQLAEWSTATNWTTG